MTRIARITAAAALPLAALATAAQAQLAGIPVYFNPRGGTGLGVAANVGFPNTDARFPFTDAGSGTAYGVALSLGIGPVTISGMIGEENAAASTRQATYGGSIAYRVFGGGLRPVAIAVQGGYGVIRMPDFLITQTTIPVGVGISFDPPAFPLKPWIAPRMDFTSFGGGSGLSNSASFHVSGGVNLDLLLGLGVHAAVDWGQKTVYGTTYAPLILSVGAHFHFHVLM